MRIACLLLLLLGAAPIGCASEDKDSSRIRYDGGERTDGQASDATASDAHTEGDAASMRMDASRTSDASSCATECKAWCDAADPECPNPGCNCSDLEGSCGVGEGSICCPASEGSAALSCSEQGFTCCGGLCTFGERAGCGEGYSCPTKCEERCAIDRTPCPIPAGCTCN